MWKVSKAAATGLALAGVGLSATANAQVLYGGKDQNIERGMHALKQGDLEQAAKHLTRASRTNLGSGRLVPVLNNLCAINYALGNLDAAEQACDRAIGEDKLFWRAYVNRGNVFKAKGDYAAAHEDYSRAAGIHDGPMPQQALARLEAEYQTLVAEVK